jgi:photosystem II stability/assembly factor-like uncharacterized protein
MTPGTLFAGYSAPDPDGSSGLKCLFKSNNGGASWNPVGTGPATFDVGVMAIDPFDQATIYTSVGGAVFKTYDSGAKWTDLGNFQIRPDVSWLGFSPGADIIRSLLIDSANPDILYAQSGRSGGCVFSDRLLLKSTDGGLSWNDSISPPGSGCYLIGFFEPSLPVLQDPIDPNVLYLGEADSEDDVLSLLKSIDGGASWSRSGVADFAANVLAIDPAVSTTLYAGTTSGVSKSTDGGATWKPTALGVEMSVNVLVIDPSKPNVLYAALAGSGYPPRGSIGGLFKSTDSGMSWFPINNGLAELMDTRSPVSTLIIDPIDSDILYTAAAGYGVFRSVDGGANWSRFSDGLANLSIRALAISKARSGTLYAATDGGIFAIALTPEKRPSGLHGRNRPD